MSNRLVTSAPLAYRVPPLTIPSAKVASVYDVGPLPTTREGTA